MWSERQRTHTPQNDPEALARRSARFLALHNAGKSEREIALELGMTLNGVRSWRRRAKRNGRI